MHRTMRRFALLSALSAVQALAWASGGAIPVWQVPVTIDQPGTYYLSRDLAGGSPSPSPLITIAADDVTLDLAGHRIERTDGRGDVIGTLGNPASVTVRNGTVIGGLHGVNLENLAGASFDVRVERLTVRGSTGDGIRVAAGFEVLVPASVMLSDNIVTGAGGAGIHVFALDAGRIAGNVVRGAGQSGLVVELSTGLFVRENDVAGSGGHGLHVLDSNSVAVTFNHLARNVQNGLTFENTTDNNCYFGNRMLDNGSDTVGRVNETQYDSLPCADNVS